MRPRFLGRRITFTRRRAKMVSMAIENAAIYYTVVPMQVVSEKNATTRRASTSKQKYATPRNSTNLFR